MSQIDHAENPTPSESNGRELYGRYMTQIISKVHNYPFKKIDLNIMMLRKAGMASPEENFASFVHSSLQFDESILARAFEQLVDAFPAPLESSDEIAAQEIIHDLPAQFEANNRVGELLSYCQEEDFDKDNLKEVKNLIVPDHSQEYQQNLAVITEKILLRAQVVQAGSQESQDPELFLRDENEMAELLDHMNSGHYIDVLEIGGKKCWSIVLDEGYREKVNRRIIVTDEEANAEITSLLLQSKGVFQDMLAYTIRDIQHDIYAGLSTTLQEVDKEIFETCKAKVELVNKYARAKLFHLLRRDIEAHNDLVAIEEKSEGVTSTHRMSLDGEGNVVFTMPTIIEKWEEDPDAPEPTNPYQNRRRIRREIPSKQVVKISLRSDRELEYEENDRGKKRIGKPIDIFSAPLPFRLLNGISIYDISYAVADWAETDPAKRTLDYRVTKLLSTNSTIEMMQMLASIEGLPGRMKIQHSGGDFVSHEKRTN